MSGYMSYSVQEDLCSEYWSAGRNNSQHYKLI